MSTHPATKPDTARTTRPSGHGRGVLTRAVTLIAVLVALVAHAAPLPLAGAQESPTWLPDWELNQTHTLEELSRAFDRDEDGVVDAAAAQTLPALLNPTDFTLRVSACAAPAGFSAVDWRLARPGEEPLPAITATECETEIPLPDRPYPEARDYTLTATVHYDGAPSQVVSVPVRVQDVFMVGFGDSYGSGEGNPLEYWDANPFSAPWDNDRCHRSRHSGQEQAARMLEQLPGVTVTFLHLACSGALASTGLLGPYEGLIAREPKLPSQIDQAAEYVRLSETVDGRRRHPDLVVTSIGGNDAGFADIVTACLLPPVVPKEVLTPPFYIPWPNSDCNAPEAPGGTAFDEALVDLAGLYQQLDGAIDANLCPGGSCELLITEYPDGATDEHGDTCSYHPPGFEGEEFQWVRDSMVPRLNGVIATAAAEHGWTYVDGVRDRFHRHGICAEDDWLRDIAESFEIQGDKNGAFHPNGAGHAFGYAPAIADAARNALGFPYRDLAFPAPLYGGTGQPTVCDDTVDDGIAERFIAAPSTDLADLDLPEHVLAEFATGTLPSASAAANSCTTRARVMPPTGVAPAEVRAGRGGCPDSPGSCVNTSTGSSSVALPAWNDDPVVTIAATADAERRAGQIADPFYRRASDAVAYGRTAFLAVAQDGAPTVTGELVVELGTRVQASGASARAHAHLRVDASVVGAEGAEDFANVRVDVTRHTCREDDGAPHGCQSTYGHPVNRFDERTVRVFGAAGEPQLDVTESWESHDANGFVPGESLRSGLSAGRGQIRVPFQVPAGSVVIVDTQADTYTSTAAPCVLDTNPFPCTANGRSTAKIGFAADPATGLLMPLTGVGGTTQDRTPPAVTASASGERGGGDWYRGPVDIALDATDDGGSGVASLTYVLDGSTPVEVAGDQATIRLTQDGPRTVTYWATDGAGNQSAQGQLTVRIDTETPSITLGIADGAEVPVHGVVPTGLSCDDTRSGVATCEGPAALDTTTPGSRTATFTATDVAGNPTERTIAYRVLSAGELIDRLRSELESLGLPRARHAELSAHVDAADRAEARGDHVAACEHLGDFVVAVERAVRQRWLASAQGEGLLAITHHAQVALRCH